jgi:predicted TIM-barrel fold metal-dependent hydrolase
MTTSPYTIDIPGPDPAPHAPGFAMPSGAWDTHFHVIDARHGFVAERSYTAPDATRESLFALHKALSIEHGVFIQVSAHGTNNAAMLEALRATPGYRGVAVVDADVNEDALRELHAAGVRGLRVNVLFGGGVGFERLEALGAKVAAMGWHMQLLLDVTAEHVPWTTIEAMPCEVVVDHMGHWDTGLGIDHPGFQRLLALIADGKAWVKLSGAERISRQTAPPFDDVVPIAKALIEAGPERCVWGSDWPHVKLPVAMLNDGDLLDLLALWAPDEAQRKKILVDNPARLYTAAD